MYGAILMAALTTTAPTSQGFCFRGGCHSSCSACSGGCYGGHQRSWCHSACGGGGGCHGSRWHGYSGYGHGHSGCYAGCFGCFCYQGAGAYGGYYGSYFPGSFLACSGYNACSGCTGYVACSGCTGCSSGCHSSATMPYAAAPHAAPPSQPYERGTASRTSNYSGVTVSSSAAEPTRAQLRIDVPTDAKVYIDDQLMNTTASPRVFQTPELKSGQLYFYDLRAEVIRDGKAVSQSQRVILRPGGEAVVSFANLGQTPATESARAE